ncbi:hypothetical protein BCR44DRAFT_1495197 [Catenaria anguillulae PL171]|uniref:Protein YIP n=1 Tax=Catenaria anguillulae PL171 TaxID=765915 RepID=A0A1Y2I1B0_9FUNG|nr:hypothetical protein BCR44DRAFT_1495197 [Catenaria anguillulae PL171]
MTRVTPSSALTTSRTAPVPATANGSSSPAPAPPTLSSGSPQPPAANNLTMDDAADRLAFQPTAISGKTGDTQSATTTATAAKTAPVSPGSLPLPVSATASTGPTMRQPVPPPADAKLWQVEYYARYFDVDTSDVINRIRWSLYPNASFATSLTLKQDLYGPFWVPTTLIFTLFVTSSLAHSIASYIAGKPYVYDFTRLTAATSTIYTYVYYGRPIRVIDLVSIYGYGVALWVPIALLCIMPFELVRWILVAVSFVITGTLTTFPTFEIRRLMTYAHFAGTFLGILVTGAVLHAVFALLLKFMFFNYDISPAS